MHLQIFFDIYLNFPKGDYRRWNREVQIKLGLLKHKTLRKKNEPKKQGLKMPSLIEQENHVNLYIYLPKIYVK